MEKDVIKGMIHCKIFLSEHFMKYSFRAISWTMNYFYFSSQCQYKNCVYREKISSDSENLTALILIDLLLKTKTKKSKRPKCIWMKPRLKNRNDKKACVSLFSELLLTDKSQHDLRMNAASYYWSYNDFYILITFHILYYLHL